MTEMYLAAAFFLAIHFLISGSRLRDRLVALLGEKVYMAGFSLASIAGLVWLILAYRRAPLLVLWEPIEGFRWLALAVMLLAFVFVVLAMMTPNATAIGGEALLASDRPAVGIMRVSRHPFLMGCALWSATHMVFNGDLAAQVFFGTFLLLSLGGPFSIDHKLRRALGEHWRRYQQLTSVFPFVAILQKRNSLRVGELGYGRLLAACLVCALFAYFHQRLFGAAVILF